MERRWLPATLRWLSPQEGGRREPPTGPEYATTARFVGEGPDATFSVVIRFKNKAAAPNSGQPVDISLLAPENLPDVERRLVDEHSLIITEGPRPVAECRLG